MEYFGSRPDGALDASLDEVDQCRLYIGVFGGRYGSGITEAEYRRARERHLPCLVYIKKSPHERDDDPAVSAQQDALLAELRLNRDHLVKEFSTADELATFIAIDLHHWLYDQYLIPQLDSAAAAHAPARDVNALLAEVSDERVRGPRADAVVSRACTERGNGFCHAAHA